MANVTAFVLWGGGSLGAAQVGMLRALTAHGVRPDLVVGASVGALNAAYYAARPDADGAEELASLWLSVSGHDVYPLSRPQALRGLTRNLPLHPLRGAWQALGAANYTFPFHPRTFAGAMLGHRDHLFDNDALRRFLDRALPIGDIEDARIPLAVLTADARGGRSVVLTRGPVIPALLASAAIPGLYPTVTIDGRALMDGGVADQTTLDYAVDQGADEVYLLTPGFSCDLPAPPPTAIAMAVHGYNLLSEQRIAASIAHNEHRTRLHLIPPLCPADVLPIDFAQTRRLIERASRATRHWLERDEPEAQVARCAGDPPAAGHPDRPGKSAPGRRPGLDGGRRRAATGVHPRPVRPDRGETRLR
jgi:NTE family protein